MRPWVDHWRNGTTLVCWWDTTVASWLFKVELRKVTWSYSHWLEGKIFLTIVYLFRVIPCFGNLCFSYLWTTPWVDGALRSISWLFCRISEDSKHVSTVLVRIVLWRCTNALWFILILYSFTAFSKLLICLNLWISCKSFSRCYCLRCFWSCWYMWWHLWALSILPGCSRRILWSISYIQSLIMFQHIFHVLGRLWLFLILLMLLLLDA